MCDCVDIEMPREHEHRREKRCRDPRQAGRAVAAGELGRGSAMSRPHEISTRRWRSVDDDALELGRGLHVERARPLERHVDDRVDPPRPRRQQHDPVGQEHRLADRMGDEQDGLARLHPDALQLQIHLVARHGVERAERLVHQQDFGIVGERAGDRRALPHAARQLARPAPLETRDADEIDELARPLAAARPWARPSSRAAG